MNLDRIGLCYTISFVSILFIRINRLILTQNILEKVKNVHIKSQRNLVHESLHHTKKFEHLVM